MTRLVALAPDGTPGELARLPSPEELDPERIARIEIRGDRIEATGWPLTFVERGLGTGALRAVIDGEAHWLGRDRDGPPIEVGGVERPALVEVPITWVTSALRWIEERGSLFRSFPWYAEPSLAPVGEWRAERFSLAAMTRDASRLDGLRAELVARIEHGGSDAFAGAIAELRRVGHDLWSIDDWGDGALWGADYMRPAEGRGLVIEVGFGPVEVAVTFDPPER